MKKILILILMFLIVAGMNLYGQVALGRVSRIRSNTYDPLTGFDDLQTIVVRNPDRTAGDFFITISGGTTNNTSNRLLTSTDGDTVNFQFYDDPGRQIIIRDITDLPSSNEVLSGSFAAGERRMTLEYYYSMPAGLFPAAGNYTDSATVTLYSGTLDNFQLEESEDVTATLRVRDNVNLSIVDQGGNYDEAQTSKTMDFGVLTRGTERYSDIIARSNTHFTLSLASGNGGVLKRTDQAEASEIPYSLYVDGILYALPMGQAVQIGASAPTGIDGLRYQVRVQIEDFWGVTSGTFEDVIQVTLSSL